MEWTDAFAALEAHMLPSGKDKEIGTVNWLYFTHMQHQMQV